MAGSRIVDGKRRTRVEAAALKEAVLNLWAQDKLTDEIAAEVGCTPGNVGAICSRARKCEDPRVMARKWDGKILARDRGVKFGRPPDMPDEVVKQVAERIARTGESVSSIARYMKVSRQSLSLRLKSLH